MKGKVSVRLTAYMAGRAIARPFPSFRPTSSAMASARKFSSTSSLVSSPKQMKRKAETTQYRLVTSARAPQMDFITLGFSRCCRDRSRGRIW